MFINISNHPSNKWGKKQIEAAMAMAANDNGNKIVADLPFPNIPPTANRNDIKEIALGLFHQARTLAEEWGASSFVAHVMGESTTAYFLIQALKTYGYKVVASTTERVSVENGDGSKTSVFEFVQFREY